MRGKVYIMANDGFSAGITPAYAGKSLTGTVWTKPPRDHPRLCGEKHTAQPQVHGHVGSPPPMRGKVFMCVAAVSKAGITPAYAGKRPQKIATRCKCWDHPRLCGEKPVPDE